jgi:hypothetical protein
VLNDTKALDRLFDDIEVEVQTRSKLRRRGL